MAKKIGKGIKVFIAATIIGVIGLTGFLSIKHKENPAKIALYVFYPFPYSHEE